MTYYASPLNDDGTPGDVDFGSSASEVTAARVALRAANREHQNMCVCDADGKVYQKIMFLEEGLLQRLDPITNQPLPRLPEDDAVPEEDRGPHYLSNCTADDWLVHEFIKEWTGKGFVVTVSPKFHSTNFINLVARK
ncbi:MAG TPA: hypothetical protein VFV84_02380 [Burkholderiales bacterium]|nr:hypothetical protein [Burkholderiales bacterium]